MSNPLHEEMIRRFVACASALTFLGMSVAAGAQSTVAAPVGGDGGNPMLAICSGFLSQGAGSVSGDKTKLCACLVRETTTKLTAAEMQAYAEASLNSQAPPPAVMDKVMAVATTCLKEAQ